MDDIPVLGWVGIACIGVLVIVMNIGLLGLIRIRPSRKLSAKDPLFSRAARDWQQMGNFVNVLRDPFAKSRTQMEQLHRAVDQLQEQDQQSSRRDD